MDNTREKLIELRKEAKQSYWFDRSNYDYYGFVADNLVANGVRLEGKQATSDESKWIPVTERLPKNFISVLGYMTDAGDFPPVRECYTVGNAFFFPALSDKHPVSHWMPLPEPPKGE